MKATSPLRGYSTRNQSRPRTSPVTRSSSPRITVPTMSKSGLGPVLTLAASLAAIRRSTRLDPVLSSRRGLKQELVLLLARNVVEQSRVFGAALGTLEREVPNARPRLVAELGQTVGEQLGLRLGREPDVLPAECDLAVDGTQALRALRRKVRVRIAFDIAVQGLDDAPVGRLAAEGEAPDLGFRRFGLRPEHRRGKPGHDRCQDPHAVAVPHVLHHPFSPLQSRHA